MDVPESVAASRAASSAKSSDEAADPGGFDLLGTACEIRGHFSKPKVNAKVAANTKPRSGRWQKQREAKKTLRGQLSPKGKMYRVHNCQSAAGRNATGVQILAGPNGVARFGGLQTCGSVWTCAVCADKIMRKREAEIAEALNKHIAADGFAVMVTLTHSHKKQDALKPLLTKYSKAVRAMTSWREYKELVASVGYVGKIRALEVTWGDSAGWHDHGHELWMLEKKLSYKEVKDLERALFPIWLKACQKVGLPLPNADHGVKIEIALSAAQYMATFDKKQKWGAGKELSRGHAKQAAKPDEGDRFSPFDLLQASIDGYREDEVRELFIEYADAYYGSRQMHWSAGLKARFGINDVNDEEAATESEAEHEVAGTISFVDWRQRVLSSRVDLRCNILEIFEENGMAAVHAFIQSLPARTARSSFDSGV